MKIRVGLILNLLMIARTSQAQSIYPHNYFRSPLNIPMQLVANFGEIRSNHWHMGLDIRTQHKVNLPVYAAADGYIARVSVEPGGFGQAIYINHPNGYTTVYGHLNAFAGALAGYVKAQQYQMQSWNVSLAIPPQMFPVKKGDLIALSGSTGASEGPHVHFEIRDTKTENCLNPLLFGFPIADDVPPSLYRLALYDRNRSTWMQSPQILPLKKKGVIYTPATDLIRIGSDRISFAVSAVDRFTGSANSNGIYGASVSVDDKTVSSFRLDNISYNDTRYINGQLDYPYKARGGFTVQHISPLPGAVEVVYDLSGGDGLIHLNDNNPHKMIIEVIDANHNISRAEFKVQYDASLAKAYTPVMEEKFFPGNVNIFEREGFQLYTTPQTIYDTVPLSFTVVDNRAGESVSPLFSFLSAAIPVHDSITVGIPYGDWTKAEWKDHIVIVNTSGSKTFVQKAVLHKGWLMARFRQFGTYQAFADLDPPTVNNPPQNLSKAGRLVFIPFDNYHNIKSFRAELDGKWLRFSNDKGHSWIYIFDEHFPPGEHELKLTIEDEAGNTTVKTWTVKR